MSRERESKNRNEKKLPPLIGGSDCCASQAQSPITNWIVRVNAEGYLLAQAVRGLHVIIQENPDQTLFVEMQY